MAFTAHIDAISVEGENVNIQVTFNDSASGFTRTQTFNFPADGSVTQASAQAQIVSVGTTLKAALTQAVTLNANLQSKVGTTITI